MGGLNLKDLEFEQEANQSPYMMNVMYRNGSFAKRYGQSVYEEYKDGDTPLTVHSAVCFEGDVYAHAGTKILKTHNGSKSEVPVVKNNRAPVSLTENDGIFIVYAQHLYYLIPDGFFEYAKKSVPEYEKEAGLPTGTDEGQMAFVKKDAEDHDLNKYYTTTKVTVSDVDTYPWSLYDGDFDANTMRFFEIEPYIPDFIVNCRADGEGGASVVEDLNILGTKFKMYYNGEDGATVYKVGPYEIADDDLQRHRSIIDWTVAPKITVNETEWTHDDTLTETNSFKVDATTKEITFSSAPGEGAMNIVMEFTLNPDLGMDKEKAKILSSKFYETFGGGNNSRLFVAGCGESKYYYSEAYDLTYFPEQNWAVIGNTEDDITGFGKQYNVLVVFKPREVHQVYSYTQTSATTTDKYEIGMETFQSKVINSRIGCDAPYSIQLVNNLLVWFNSREGVCVLTSTNIQDERNVRVISRNIERMNNYEIPGILDLDDDAITVQSADFDRRYFLVFPKQGYCFMWDYEIVPYTITSRGGETDPRTLDWFVFDHFYVKQFLRMGKKLLYISNYQEEVSNVVTRTFKNQIIEVNESFEDLDFNNDGNTDAIHSYYMTPFLQFGAVEMLKNVKNLYVQVRGDTASIIDMAYYTENDVDPRSEAESINIGGRIWRRFRWLNFQWYSINYAKTFRRKCNLKKIEMCAFFFENNERGRDLSITNIGLQYQLVKYIR